jgi:hypothetical protein
MLTFSYQKKKLGIIYIFHYFPILIGKKNFKRLSAELKPGDSFVLHHRAGEVIAVDWTPAPKVEKSK